ncbi:cytochrome P450 18a1-like [Zerene cesonia]|uniref:cytochrome P450 18a1-like n=1 Tax=Zerene cesonia TaxID=33412 RepID=UPI0018E536B6|nr:cytochrome P450 18a1-like [Zerene cesonia]
MILYILEYTWAYISSLSLQMIIRFILVTLVVALISSHIVQKVNYLRKLPPGPWGLPILGCLPWMSQGAPHSWYLSLAARYGDLFSLKLGSNLVVCIGSPKILRDVFNRLDSTGRPHTPLNNLLGGFGIILSEGELWKRQRQFLHEKFRALGVKLWTNQRFEKFIIAEIEEFLTQLEYRKGQALDPVLVFGRHMHNIICQLMMSFRFEENDPNFEFFNERISRGMKLYGSVHIGEHLSHYMKLPGKKAVLKEIQANLNDICNFHEQHLKKREEKYLNKRIGHYEPEDLLDFYVVQIQKEKDNDLLPSIFKDNCKVQQVVQVMNDLFSAGMETSRTAIVWILIIMLKEPEIAAKVRSDLADVVGVGNLVTLEDRLALPYLEAVIFETLRRVSVVPLGTSHVNLRKWEINGYMIPAGSIIVPLINKMNMDPELFPEPEKFIPERFLKNGKVFIPDYFMPFGVGRRVCLGEQLARMELFLFFANLMNHYEIAMPEGEAIPDLEGTFGTTHAPLPYKLVFRKLVT